MRAVLGLALGAMVLGCASVDVHYDDVPAFDDVKGAAERAAAGLSYYSLARIHLAAAPSSAPTGRSNENPGAGEAPTAKDLPPAGSKPEPPAASKSGAGSASKGPARQGAGVDEASGGGGGTDAAASGATPPTPTTSDGKVGDHPWTVRLTVGPDASHGFMMGGTNGFWRKTTVTASRTPNSDRPNSVTIKAENLTATRLGQIATVIGYVISPGGASRGIAGTPETDQPPPFEFDVDREHINATNPVAEGSDWSYRLDIPTPTPAGAVSFDRFLTAAKDAKTVNYFPVPACISGHLYLYKADVQMADFPLVVANPDVVRLEPLPLDGKLTLSSICGASVQGATKVDTYDELFSDLAALQKVYMQVTKPNGEKAGGDEAGAGDSADGNGPNSAPGGASATAKPQNGGTWN